MSQQTPYSFQPGKLLVCLLAAALFWLMNALNKPNYSLNVDYPVRFVYNDSLFVPTTALPRSVRVNMSGNGWQLLGLSWLSFQNEPVEYSVKNPLQASVLNTSAMAAALSERVKRLHINYVVADTVELGFDQRIHKTIQLVADSTHINLAPRFVVSSRINLTPATLLVEGPARLVKGFPDTIRIKIPGKRISGNFDEELPVLGFKHPQVKTNIDKVFVSFEVAELLSPIK